MRKLMRRGIVGVLVAGALTFVAAPAQADDCAEWAKVGWNDSCVQY